MTADRSRGSLIGLAIGDAMGAPTEGMTPESIRSTFGWVDALLPGAAGTDDTEYAVLTARAVLEHGEQMTADHVGAAWLAAVEQQDGGFGGAGFSEMVAISSMRRGLGLELTGIASYERWSDGAAMRVAPIGIFAAGRPAEARRLAAVDAGVSHSADGVICAQAIAAAVSTALTVDDHHRVLDAAVAALPDGTWSHRLVRRALEIAIRHPDARSAIPELYEQISIFEYPWADAAPEATALALAIFAAARGDFSDAVLASVNIGRDSDTIAAMNGALCGALAGYDALPPAWRDPVREVSGTCIADTAGTDLIDLADRLHALGVARYEGARP